MIEALVTLVKTCSVWNEQQKTQVLAWLECAREFGTNLDKCSEKLEEAKEIIRELLDFKMSADTSMEAKKCLDARVKAIKLYWKIAKERCPFQTEEMVHSFLEGFIDCAEYLLLRDTGLKKENAVLKERNIKDCKNFNRAVEKISEQLNQKQYQLTKARTIIKSLLDDLEFIDGEETKQLKTVKEAEQFLNSEVEE